MGGIGFMQSEQSSRSDKIVQNHKRFFLLAGLAMLLLMGAGCGKKKTATCVAPPPSLDDNASYRAAHRGHHQSDEAADTDASIHVDPNARVLWTQNGRASWYGREYNQRRAANGEIYDQNRFTAAHNTLPLNSIVRVTNLKNQKQVVLRITDRGPFVTDRVIDLSVGSAKALGVYLPGTAPVRIDVLEAPKPIETGGRWCLQMGAFKDRSTADDTKSTLLNKYDDAKVIEFQGPTGWWVRMRLPNDDKKQTREALRHVAVNEGAVFLVRLD